VKQPDFSGENPRYISAGNMNSALQLLAVLSLRFKEKIRFPRRRKYRYSNLRRKGAKSTTYHFLLWRRMAEGDIAGGKGYKKQFRLVRKIRPKRRRSPAIN